MKTIILITCYLFGLFVFLSCETDTMPDPVTLYGTIEKVQVYSPSLEGNLLGDPAERDLFVYLPKSYYTNPGKRFPVIYYLHGWPAIEHSVTDPSLVAPTLSDYPKKWFVSWINNLINEGGMKEAIIVMPDATNRYAVSFYTNNQVQGNYEDYIVDDLVLYMDMNFKTIPHANYRAITGHFTGGYGALRIAMRHPDVFQYVAGLSPLLFTQELVMAMAERMIDEDTAQFDPLGRGIKVPVWGFKGPSSNISISGEQFKFANNYMYSGAAAWLPNPENQPYYVDLPFRYEEGKMIINDERMAKWTSESLFNLVLNNSNGLKELKSISFDCGLNDDLMMYPPNLALHNMLVEIKVKHRFESFEGTHFNNLYDRLGKVLVDLSNDFPVDD